MKKIKNFVLIICLFNCVTAFAQQEMVYSNIKDLLFEQGKVLLVRKDYPAALSKFQECLEHAKDDKLILEYISVCKQDIENFQIEGKWFLQIKQKEQEFFIFREIKDLIKRGKDYYKLSMYDLSDLQFERVLFLDSVNEIAKNYRNLIQNKKQEIEKQDKEINKLRLNIDKSLKQSEINKMLLQAAKELYLKGSFRLALKKFNQLEKKEPLNPIVVEYITLCENNIGWQKEKEKRILNLKEKEFAIKKNNLEFSYLIDKENKLRNLFYEAKELYFKGYFDSAISFFTYILEFDKKNKIVKDYILLCRQARELRKLIEEKDLDIEKKQSKIKEKVALVIKKQEQINILFEKAKDFYEKGLYKEAISYFEDILYIDARNEAAKDYLAFCKNRLDYIQKTGPKKPVQKIKFDKQKNIKKFIEFYEGFEEKLKSANEFYRQGLYKLAIQAFTEVLKIEPDNKYAQEYIKLCEKSVGLDKVDAQKNKDDFQKKIKQKAFILFKQGCKLYSNKKYKEAVKILKQAWNLYPDISYAEEIQKLLELAHKKEAVC
jgi:tetratricopeptide (TPR) repeat protein